MSVEVSKDAEPCGICGEPSRIADGVIGYYLCESDDCFMEAWDRAWR